MAIINSYALLAIHLRSVFVICVYILLECYYNQVQKVASQINQDIEDRQNRDKIHAFEAQFCDDTSFIRPSRKLVRHGPLIKSSAAGDQRK